MAGFPTFDARGGGGEFVRARPAQQAVGLAGLNDSGAPGGFDGDCEPVGGTHERLQCLDDLLVFELSGNRIDEHDHALRPVANSCEHGVIVLLVGDAHAGYRSEGIATLLIGGEKPQYE